jgi:hypothetical protein
MCEIMMMMMMIIIIIIIIIMYDNCLKVHFVWLTFSSSLMFKTIP